LKGVRERATVGIKMARKLRIEFEGAIYHVLNRGNYRQAGKRGLAEFHHF
jgi:hypothetical protein